jgi:hypothetical protein
MTNRISKKLVTFLNAFRLENHEEPLPAGDYTIETEEEPLASGAMTGFHRIRTTLILRPVPGRTGRTRYIELEPSELEGVLALDRDGIERAENEGMSK